MQISHSSEYTIHQVGNVPSEKGVDSDPLHSRLPGEGREGQKGVGVRKPISTKHLCMHICMQLFGKRQITY